MSRRSSSSFSSQQKTNYVKLSIKQGRQMLGETQPLASKPGSIRGDYSIDLGRNICHGSDSPEAAEHELKMWFPEGVNVRKNYAPSNLLVFSDAFVCFLSVSTNHCYSSILNQSGLGQVCRQLGLRVNIYCTRIFICLSNDS